MYLVNLNLDKSDVSPYLSTTLLNSIEKQLAEWKKTILYINKRGAFSSMVCTDCSYLFECHQCDSSLNVHHHPDMLTCHLCGHKENLPKVCKSCKKSNIKSVWVGTQQVEEALERYFNTPKQPHPNPLLSGEGEMQSNVIQNYKKVPDYVKDLSKQLRQDGTKTEEILWELLRNRKLHDIKFRRQHPFGRYIVDFYSNDLNLVIELGGWIHDTKWQQEYDTIRDEIISKYSVQILRIKNEEIENNIDSVIQKIINYIPSPDRRWLGWGWINIFRFDSDSMKNKTDKATAVEQISAAEIIIGTKMITTGFDFDNIGMIWVILIEAELKIPKYNTHEKVYNNITQLLGRWGRRWAHTDYIIQTFIPNNTLITHITSDNYKDFFLHTLQERKLFWYPPFQQFAILEYRHGDRQKSIDFLAKISTKLEKNISENAQIIKNPNVFKKHNQYFSTLIVKWSDIRENLQTIKRDIFSNSGLTIHFE